MRILSLLGIKPKATQELSKAAAKTVDSIEINPARVLAQNTSIKASEIKNFLTLADGIDDFSMTNRNFTLYSNELIDIARGKKVQIRINKLDDEAVILSVKRNTEDAKPFVVANFFNGNEKHLPIIDKITKSVEDAYALLLKDAKPE